MSAPLQLISSLLKASGGGGGGGGSITFIGTPTTSGNAVFISLPTGSASGDRVYINAFGGGTPVSISGMTLITSGIDATSVKFAVFARTINAGDVSNGYLTIPAGSVAWICWSERGSTSQTEESIGTKNNYTNNTTTSAPGSSTSTVDLSAHIVVFNDDQHANTVATPPAGYTLLASFGTGSTVEVIYYKIITPAGTTGSPVVVWNTSGAYGCAYGFISKA